MNKLSVVVGQLRKERNEAARILQSLDAAIAALSGGASARRTGRRTLSAAGRARIVAAQRARWAKFRGKKVVSMPKKKKAAKD